MSGYASQPMTGAMVCACHLSYSKKQLSYSRRSMVWERDLISKITTAKVLVE
jgi:hypothetical protein